MMVDGSCQFNAASQVPFLNPLYVSLGGELAYCGELNFLIPGELAKPLPTTPTFLTA